MTQLQTMIPSFVAINPTLTFLKPELRVLISDKHASIGRPFTPRTFLTLIDIEGDRWTNEQRARFYSENFTNSYDIIECSVRQLPATLSMCEQYPTVLILHANENERELRLPTKDIGFFIVIGNIAKFRITADDSGVVVFHKGHNAEQQASFYIGDDVEPIEDPEIDYIVDYNIHPADPRLQEELRGRFRPAGQASTPLPGQHQRVTNTFQNALIRQFGPNDQFDSGKEIYIISGQDTVRGSTLYASIVAPTNGNGIMITDARAPPALSDQTTMSDNDASRSVIVHGRLTAARDKQMIRMDASRKIQVFFPDMSQKEVDSILFNHKLLYGNDRPLKSGREVIGATSLYFVDGLTFAEQILYQTPKQGPDDKTTHFGRMMTAKEGRLLSCISYIDNYFETVRLKRPNGFFQYMITRYAAELEVRGINFGALRHKESIYGLIAAVKERLQSESQVDSNRRQIMLSRIRSLVEHQRPIPPYYLESAVDDPVLSEEQRFREKHHYSNKHDPMTHERRHYILRSTKERKRAGKPERYVISEVNYMILDGKDYDCVIHNCGFVILKGTGKVRVSGTLHSLVCYGGVHIKLDNVSPMAFRPDIFLFTENGSVYDTITNYKDNLPSKTIDEIIKPRLEEKRIGNIIIFPDKPQEPPEFQTPDVFSRSVVRNLYVAVLPENYLTSMIENLIDLGQSY